MGTEGRRSLPQAPARPGDSGLESAALWIQWKGSICDREDKKSSKHQPHVHRNMHNFASDWLVTYFKVNKNLLILKFLGIESFFR